MRTVLANTRQLWGSRREEAPSDAIPGMGSLFRSPSLAIKLCLYLTVFKTLGSGEAWNGTGSRDAPSLRSMWDRLVRTPITFRSRRLAWEELLRRAWRLEYHPLMKRSQIGCRQLKPRQAYYSFPTVFPHFPFRPDVGRAAFPPGTGKYALFPSGRPQDAESFITCYRTSPSCRAPTPRFCV